MQPITSQPQLLIFHVVWNVFRVQSYCKVQLYYMYLLINLQYANLNKYVWIKLFNCQQMQKLKQNYG